MSIHVMSQVWRKSKQELGGLLVLLALADFANDDGICWPSIPKLATKSRLSERQVQRVIQDAVESGEITVEVGAGPLRSNLYRVTMHGDNLSPVTPGASDGDILSPSEGDIYEGGLGGRRNRQKTLEQSEELITT